MSSRLPRSRPSRRPYRIPVGIGTGTREGTRLRIMRHREADREEQLAADLLAIGVRFGRDPNGYTVAKGGRIVARCPNLNAVAAWLADARGEIADASSSGAS